MFSTSEHAAVLPGTSSERRVRFVKTESGWGIEYLDPNPETRYIPPSPEEIREAIAEAWARAGILNRRRQR